MDRKTIFRTIFVCSMYMPLLLCFHCAIDDPVSDGGAGTGTGNPVILCEVFTQAGTPAEGARALLRPQNYLSSIEDSQQGLYDSIGEAYVESSGRLLFDSVAVGEYFIEVATDDDGSLLMACTVSTDTSLVVLPADTLKPTKQIKGTVALFGGSSTDNYVLVYGLERAVLADSDGSFTITVPEGTYILNVVPQSTEYTPVDIKHIESNDTNVVSKILSNDPVSTSYACDSLIVRAILDSNGLLGVPVNAVSFTSNGRIYQIDIEIRQFYQVPAIISGMVTLEDLEIQYCQVAELPSTIGMMDLDELELDSCQLTTLPETFVNLDNLIELDLRGNRLLGNLSPAVEAWADEFDPDWKEVQVNSE